MNQDKRYVECLEDRLALHQSLLGAKIKKSIDQARLANFGVKHQYGRHPNNG